VKDIDAKEPELGNGSVYGPVREMTGFLDKNQERPHVIPVSLFRSFPENRLEEIEIGRDVGSVRLDSMCGKTAV
jgi:hypothetical protein